MVIKSCKELIPPLSAELEEKLLELIRKKPQIDFCCPKCGNKEYRRKETGFAPAYYCAGCEQAFTHPGKYTHCRKETFQCSVCGCNSCKDYYDLTEVVIPGKGFQKIGVICDRCSAVHFF